MYTGLQEKLHVAQLVAIQREAVPPAIGLQPAMSTPNPSLIAGPILHMGPMSADPNALPFGPAFVPPSNPLPIGPPLVSQQGPVPMPMSVSN